MKLFNPSESIFLSPSFNQIIEEYQKRRSEIDSNGMKERRRGGGEWEESGRGVGGEWEGSERGARGEEEESERVTKDAR